MKRIICVASMIGLLGLLTGCGQTPASKTQAAPPDPEKKIADNLAKLGDDKEMASAQRFCAVQGKSRLGSMGVPVKITFKDKAAFLCCEECRAAAEKDLEGTIKRAEDLSIQTAIDQLPPEDRKLAESQRYCASDGETRLGSMDKPIKLMVKGQPVFICCGGCEKVVRADEDKALALVKKLQADNSKK